MSEELHADETARRRVFDWIGYRRENNIAVESLSAGELVDVVRQLETEVAQLRVAKNLADLDLTELEKLASEREKRASASEATVSRLENMVDNAENVISTIKTAKEQVSGTTAGLGGRLLSLTESATNLEENLNTIKANLGFDRLQQMRNESKTGGALGQVAVKELDRLEAARASLNRAQGPEQLKKNLDNVLEAYTNWRDAANKALAEKKAKQPNAPAINSFNSVEEAMKAKLPKGTIITINGRRAVVE